MSVEPHNIYYHKGLLDQLVLDLGIGAFGDKVHEVADDLYTVWCADEWSEELGVLSVDLFCLLNIHSDPRKDEVLYDEIVLLAPCSVGDPLVVKLQAHVQMVQSNFVRRVIDIKLALL